MTNQRQRCIVKSWTVNPSLPPLHLPQALLLRFSKLSMTFGHLPLEAPWPHNPHHRCSNVRGPPNSLTWQAQNEACKQNNRHFYWRHVIRFYFPKPLPFTLNSCKKHPKKVDLKKTMVAPEKFLSSFYYCLAQWDYRVVKAIPRLPRRVGRRKSKCPFSGKARSWPWLPGFTHVKVPCSYHYLPASDIHLVNLFVVLQRLNWKHLVLGQHLIPEIQKDTQKKLVYIMMYHERACFTVSNGHEVSNHEKKHARLDGLTSWHPDHPALRLRTSRLDAGVVLVASSGCLSTVMYTNSIHTSLTWWSWSWMLQTWPPNPKGFKFQPAWSNQVGDSNGHAAEDHDNC